MSDFKHLLKRTVFLLAAAVFIGVALYELCTVQNPVRRLSFLSEAEAARLTEGLRPLTLSDETLSKKGLMLNGMPAPYVPNEKSYYVPVDLQRDKNWAFGFQLQWDSPLFCVYAIADTNTAFSDAVAESRTLPLLAVSRNGYFSLNIKFTGLPLLTMETSNQLNSCYGNAHEQGGLLRIYDPAGGENGEYCIFSTAMRYARRGASSKNYIKPQYKLELLSGDGDHREEALLGLGKTNALLLHAQYLEQSEIRQRLSLGIWNALCDDDPSRGNSRTVNFEYVEAISGGEYLGLMGVTERFIPAKDTFSDQEILLKSILPFPKDAIEEALKTAYRRHHLEYVPSPLGSILRLTAGSIDHIREGLAYLASYVMRSEKYPAPESLDEILETVSLNNAIDYALYINLICGIDNVYSNYYLLGRNTGKNGTLQFSRVPWDLDLTFAHGFGNPVPEYEPRLIRTNMFTPEIQLLLETNEDVIWPMLTERWGELRKTAFSDQSLFRLVDESSALMHQSGAAIREYALWGKHFNPNGGQNLKHVISTRLAFLDAYYGKDAPDDIVGYVRDARPG